MKAYIKTSILTLFIVLLAVFTATAQSSNTLRLRCPNTSIYSIVQITGVGDINVQPCSGHTTTFTQNVVLPSGTVIAGGTFKANNGTAGAPSYSFVNSPTTGFYRLAADTIGVSTAGALNSSFSSATNSFTSPIQTFTSSTSDNHKTALFTIDTVAGGSQWAGSFSTGAGVGLMSFGDCVTTPTVCLSLDQSGTSASLSTTTTTGLFLTTAGNIMRLGSGSAIDAGVLNTVGIRTYNLQRTITPAGTTGPQTISKQAGTVNVAAGQASIVVTNSTVDTSSIVNTVLRTADGTCTFVKSAVPTANTITITLNANCTAETSVGFVVWN